MLFFGGETNSLAKGSSIAVFRGSGDGKVAVMVPVMGLVSMLIKHVGEDRNKDIGAELMRVWGGGILIELPC